MKARLGLAKQLFMGVALLSCLFAISSTIAESFWDYQRGVARADAVSASIESYYLPKIKHSLIVNDQYQLNQIAKELYRQPEVQAISIFNNWGELLRLGQFSDSEYVRSWPILSVTDSDVTTTSQLKVVMDSPVGWALDFDHLRQLFATQAILAILIGLVFFGVVNKNLIGPLRVMAKRVGEIDDNNLPKLIQLRSRWFKDEVTQFNQRYNESVERVRGTFFELAERCMEAEEAKKRKSESMATVSHEIRTSLNGVFGLIALLKEHPSERELDEYTSLLQSTAVSLQDLVNDIHDLSQIEVGELTLMPGPLNIAELVDDLDAAFRAKATEKDLLFQCTVDASISRLLVGDKARLRQILRNLVSNAIKFTENGYVLLDIQHLAFDENSETLLVEVKDSGIGVAKEQQENIFEQAFSTDRDGKVAMKGSGIRLGISRHLVRLMGSDLKIDSEPGLGSHFYFTIRLATQKSMSMDNQESLLSSRALVVDDSPFNMKITAIQLTKMGLETQCCEDETKVMDLVYEAAHLGNPYQLIVLDKNMPQIDGVDLAKSICDAFPEPSPAILMISAEDLDFKELIPSGISGYLCRPYRTEDLEHQVHRLLQPKAEQLGFPVEQNALIRPALGGAIKILLVEDQVSNQVVMKKMLQRLGVEVSVAENGRIAVSKCAVSHYDLVLMDCQMPVMDGFEATMSIRKMEAGGVMRVPIVALTANVLAEEKSRCFEAGMDGFVSKPVNFSKLSHTLRSHIPTFEFIVDHSSPFTPPSSQLNGN